MNIISIYIISCFKTFKRRKNVNKKIKIEGLRGFSKEMEIEFAVPDKINIGSGLTVLVGPNNSGKSTIIEAVHLLSSTSDTLPKGCRNIKNDGFVKAEAEDVAGNIVGLSTTANKGAFIKRYFNDRMCYNYPNTLNTFILTSKRGLYATFSNNRETRSNYNGNVGNDEYRNESGYNNFGGRLLNIYNDNRQDFDSCLKKVLAPIPEWTIEAQDSNNCYLEFSFNGIKHSSKGSGDGYINIFNIIDALYDSSEDNVILIDEPEISLHPDLQRKLFDLLIEYSKDKQIILSTHSPYFVNWNLFAHKSKVIRLKKEKAFIKKYELSDISKVNIKGILDDDNNPHTLSLNANEIFFLNDNIILVEGQEDVVCYKKIFSNYNYKVNASFFGWGVGGATKFEKILLILKDLGYNSVFCILDNDMKTMAESLKKKFPQYGFYAIAADDIRNKEDSFVNSLIEIFKKRLLKMM